MTLVPRNISAKFGPNWCSGVDLYIKRYKEHTTDRKTDEFLLYIQIQKWTKFLSPLGCRFVINFVLYRKCQNIDEEHFTFIDKDPEIELDWGITNNFETKSQFL